MKPLLQKLTQEITKLEGVTSKSRGNTITFARRLVFASLTPHKDRVKLSFITPSKINHSRMEKVEQLKPNKFRHTVSIKDASDIDPQTTGWIMIAHATN